MKRVIAVAALALLAMSCGGGDQATPSPSPSAPTATGELAGNIMKPADRTRDVVDQLNNQQEQTENTFP